MMTVAERAALRDKLFRTIVEEHGSMVTYYVENSLRDAAKGEPENGYMQQHNIKHLYLHAVEAWHFASRLTPEALQRALALPPLADDDIPF